MALIFGGGTNQGLWSDAIVQLASLGLIGLLMPALAEPAMFASARNAFIIVACIVALPLLQLIPLPPMVWTLLPGRADIATEYAATGTSLPWLPISLNPAATWRSFLSLVPPVAVFWATASLGFKARRSLTLLIIAIGVVSVFLGLAQLMQGPSSPLRFYPVTNPKNSVGFFANRNHYAALLYSIIPFTTAWIVSLLFDRRIDRVFGLAVAILVYAALILGLGMALSRAGISLAVIAALASLLLVASHQPRVAKHGLMIISGATVLGAVSVVQFSWFSLLGRFDDNILADYRLRIAQTAIEAAKAFQPFGSGLGTFVPIYQMFEHTNALLPAYINHAHDDWLELWLETGWFGLAILGAFLLWFVTVSIRTWRSRPAGGHEIDQAVAQAASIVIVLLLLHSTVDYPLRTTAMMTLFAFCCGLLIEPRNGPRRQTTDPDHHDQQRPAHRPRTWFWSSRRRGRGSAWQTRRFR